ncbi:hypothetical protein [Alcaligenes aquatilis]
MPLNIGKRLADEARYFTFGDPVHYVDPSKVFTRYEGSYLV